MFTRTLQAVIKKPASVFVRKGRPVALHQRANSSDAYQDDAYDNNGYYEEPPHQVRG